MADYTFKNPEAVMSTGQGYELIRQVGPLDCLHKPAVAAMVASGITMQQISDSIKLMKSGNKDYTAAEFCQSMKARIEELASAAGAEVNPNWREEAEEAKKPAPVKELEVPQTLLDRVAELEAQNTELRVAAYGEGLETPEGMTWVRSHFRASK